MWRLIALVETDADQILKIENRSFSRAWRRSAFIEELSRSDSFSYGVNCTDSPIDRSIIAYICYRIVCDEMHLLKIAVAPEWRSRGIGTWLLNECMKKEAARGIDQILLEVRPSNRPALAMYGRMGFWQIGKRPKYYPDTREDALVLSFNLQEVSWA